MIKTIKNKFGGKTNLKTKIVFLKKKHVKLASLKVSFCGMLARLKNSIKLVESQIEYIIV